MLMKNKSYSINSDDGLVLGIKVSNNDLTNANDTGLTSQTRRPVVATTAFATSTQMLRQRLLQERNSHSVENCADSYNYSFLDPAELMITPLFDSISNRHRIVRMLIILADANDHYSDSVVAEALKQQLPALYFIEVTLIDGRNRSSWYNPHELSNTDIVINFNWRYSLKNAITAIKPTATVYNYFHLKPALIAIAWIPNVANQLPHETKGAEGKDQEDISSWLSHSFLGNYDGIISSENSMNFLNSYNHYFGFPVNCFQGCPVIMKYQKSNESELNDNSTEYITLSSKRRRVLIRKLDLDTEAIKLVVQLRDFLHRFGVVLQGKSATESEFDSNMEPTPQPTMLPKGLYPEEYKKLLRQEKKRKNDRSKPPLAANILANTRQLSRFFSEKSFLRNMRANSTNALNGPATKEEVLSSVLQEMKAADENHLNSDYSDGDDGKTQKVWDRTKRSSVCVGIRTVYSQRRWVEILLLSLLAQYEASPFSYNINFHIFVIDTEHSTAFQTLLLGLAAKLNEEYRKKYVHIVSERYSTRRSYQNPFYGYDSTDLLLPKMIEEYRTSIDKDDKNYENSHSNTSANSAATNTNCEWILLTNGDNMYNSALLDTIAPHLLNKEVEIIAWDFITHHLRKDIPNTPTTVAWKRKYIDLGKS